MLIVLDACAIVLIVCVMDGFQTREMFYVDLVFCFAVLCGMCDKIGLS